MRSAFGKITTYHEICVFFGCPHKASPQVVSGSHFQTPRRTWNGAAGGNVMRILGAVQGGDRSISQLVLWRSSVMSGNDGYANMAKSISLENRDETLNIWHPPGTWWSSGWNGWFWIGWWFSKSLGMGNGWKLPSPSIMKWFFQKNCLQVPGMVAPVGGVEKHRLKTWAFRPLCDEGIAYYVRQSVEDLCRWVFFWIAQEPSKKKKKPLTYSISPWFPSIGAVWFSATKGPYMWFNDDPTGLAQR